MNLRERIWDLDMFRLYLKIYKDINLESILHPTKNKDIVLVNAHLLEKSRADSDGDLNVLFVLNYQGQQILKDFKFDNIQKRELEWHKTYVTKELNATSDLSKDHIYKLHKIPYVDYNKFLRNAVAAKSCVGNATVQAWIFSMIMEVYSEYFNQNKGMYIKKDHNVPMTRISREEIDELNFIYIELLQTFAIEGIKHIENGSKSIEIYYLNKISEQANSKKVRSQLISNFKVQEQLIDKLMFIIKWAIDNHNLVKACANYVSLYNKGKFPANSDSLDYWEKFISDHTYFGSLLTLVTGIKNQFIQNKFKSSLELKTKLNELDNSDDLEFVM